MVVADSSRFGVEFDNEVDSVSSDALEPQSHVAGAWTAVQKGSSCSVAVGLLIESPDLGDSLVAAGIEGLLNRDDLQHRRALDDALLQDETIARNTSSNDQIMGSIGCLAFNVESRWLGVDDCGYRHQKGQKVHGLSNHRGMD